MGPEALRIAATVVTPIALICFVVAVLAWLRFRHYQHEERQLSALAEPDRAKDREEWFIKAGFDLANATREQKHEFALKKLEQDGEKARRASADNRLYAILAAVAFLILFVVATVAYLLAEDKPVKAKANFDFEHAFRANGPEFPTDLFGSPADHDGMPRLWMRLLESGAPEIIQFATKDTGRVWLWSEPFEERYYPFTAHVYTGTDGKVIACAFLVEPGRPPKASLLRRVTAQERAGLVLFDVPQSPRNSRLLVFLAMNAANFPDVKKIHLRSEAFRTTS